MVTENVAPPAFTEIDVRDTVPLTELGFAGFVP
jgi:hypothetical protein